MLLSNVPKFSLLCSKLCSIVLQFCSENLNIVCSIRVFDWYIILRMLYQSIMKYEIGDYSIRIYLSSATFSFKANRKCTFCHNYLLYQLVTILTVMICTFSGDHCTNFSCYVSIILYALAYLLCYKLISASPKLLQYECMHQYSYSQCVMFYLQALGLAFFYSNLSVKF